MLNLIRDAWIILGVSLVLLLIVDAGLKSVLEETPLPTVVAGATAPDRNTAPALAKAEWTADYFAELRRARHTRWSPWEYWRRLPFQGVYINVDSQGIRRSFEPDHPQWTIWMAGGSTVWGTGARDDHTLPSALARALLERGISARVVNLGESGYVSGQSQIRVMRRLESEPAPDLIVFYDGVNDVYSALQAGTPGRSQNEHHRQADFRVTDGLDNYLQAAPRVLEGVSRLLARRHASAPRDLNALSAGIASIYAARVRASRAVADGAGTVAVFFWQPSVFSKAQPHESESQIIAASLADHQTLQLAADGAVSDALSQTPYWFSLTDTLDGSEQALFMDFCHLSEAGNRLIGEQMADQVAPLLVSD